MQKPISCNSTVNIDQTVDLNRDAEAADAVDQLTHATGSGSADSVTGVLPPFEYVTGSSNPAAPGGKDVLVTNSLVTIPVIDTSTFPTGFPATHIIGFLQVFLLEFGNPVIGNNHVDTQVVNIVGCGSNATGTAISGNGASPVAVRLILPD